MGFGQGLPEGGDSYGKGSVTPGPDLGSNIGLLNPDDRFATCQM